jgi:DNA-binding NarL/FixJ family response regulator
MSERVPTNATVMMVEDEAVSRVWLDSLIGEVFPDASLITVTTVQEAVDTLSSRPIDVALVDLGLPDGSGVQVIRRLARLNPLALSIVVTGFDDDEHVLEAIQAGAQGYLLKTQPADVVIGQLRLLAEGIPQLSPSVARRLLQYFSGAQRDPAPRPAERDAALDDQLLPLSAREQEVLMLIAKGLQIAQVAQALGITANTVCSHIKNIYRKRSVSSRAEAALEARRLGLI